MIMAGYFIEVTRIGEISLPCGVWSIYCGDCRCYLGDYWHRGMGSSYSGQFTCRCGSGVESQLLFREYGFRVGGRHLDSSNLEIMRWGIENSTEEARYAAFRLNVDRSATLEQYRNWVNEHPLRRTHYGVGISSGGIEKGVESP